MPSPLPAALTSAADRILPRILTQACRDPSHPAYGCFDRNWWHYKIRDFPSIILQQAGYALWEAAPCTDHPQQKGLRDLAKAACLFWNKRALRHGAFEEYYPWEQGYPPLAFGALAVAKLVHQGAIDEIKVDKGLAVATRQLIARFESEAANQQVAGLAALAVLRGIQPGLVPSTDYERILTQTLALQTPEGWFGEYGGPDIGYLSVTIDCLWDIHDHQPDDRIMASLLAACRFISQITVGGRLHVGLHNARNTDYLVPYGLVRASYELAPHWIDGPSTVEAVFQSASDPEHFLNATDDRYLCHYIGHSVFRARNYLHQHPISEIADPSHLPQFSRHGALSRHFPLSSHYLFPAHNDRPFGAIITPKKGGIVSLQNGPKQASDYGWVIEDLDSEHISHWWSDEWKWREENAGTLTIEGSFYVHRETESSPLKHLVLRVMSLLLGRSIIARLKSHLIFKRARSPYRFKRCIKLDSDMVRVSDEIFGLRNLAVLGRAPRPSKRHVASADSFHPEDLTLLQGFTRDETITTTPDAISIETVYRTTERPRNM